MALVHCVFLKVWSDGALNIFIRQISDEDCRDIHEWRNDITTRQMSLNGDTVDYEHHRSWFSKVLSSDEHVGLVGETNYEKIGIVHFREHEKQTFVSINLNPIFRGKGLSSTFLAKSLDFYLIKHFHITHFLAEIKCDNIKSERIFKNNNFVFVSNNDGVNMFRRVNIINKGGKNVRN